MKRLFRLCKEEQFKMVISDVAECHNVCDQLSKLRGEQEKTDKSNVLLSLYELEATAKLLGSYPQHNVIAPELNGIFQRLVEMPAADLKTFETVSALAME